jgi:hypothetical protein
MSRIHDVIFDALQTRLFLGFIVDRSWYNKRPTTTRCRCQLLTTVLPKLVTVSRQCQVTALLWQKQLPVQ